MSLTSAGLTIKRLSDLVEDLSEGIRNEFGASTNTDADSVFGQIIGVFANELELVYELAQQLYDSFDPDQAEGASLDNICALLGLDRQAATSSSVELLLTGDDGVVVPAASIAATDDVSATEFQTSENVTITRSQTSDLGQATFDVAQTIQRSVGSWIDDDVFPGMEVEIIGSTSNDGTYEVESVTTLTLTLVAGSGISNEVPAFGAVTAFRTLATVTALAVDTGPLPAVSGSLTTIVTPVTGWSAVYNYNDASLGDANESDEELRNRRELSLNVVGAGVDWAIRSKLLAIPDVDYALVLSNRSSVTSPDGIPPHAFETVVYPDLATVTYRDQIAQTIFYLQPAGIEAHGTLTFDVLDGQGVTQQVKYTFATELTMHVLAVVSVDSSPANTYPADGDSQVATALLTEGNGLAVGDDVLNWKFVSSLDSIPGILDVDIYIRQNIAPPLPPGVDPAYQANIAVNYKQIAKFDSSRIVVVSS